MARPKKKRKYTRRAVPDVGTALVAKTDAASPDSAAPTNGPSEEGLLAGTFKMMLAMQANRVGSEVVTFCMKRAPDLPCGVVHEHATEVSNMVQRAVRLAFAMGTADGLATAASRRNKRGVGKPARRGARVKEAA